MTSLSYEATIETKNAAPVTREEFETLMQELQELKGKQVGNPNGTLPDNAFIGKDGELYHRISRITEGGAEVISIRRLARTLEESRDKRIDFYHPTLGLIWEGYKLASDRGDRARLDDDTNTLPIHIPDED